LSDASTIDAATLRAFEETEYHVRATPPFTLRIGASSPALAALHLAHGVHSSAFITACNPRCAVLDDPSNSRRQDELRRELTHLQLAYIPGTGQHPTNGWPGEESFLVLGLALAEARGLGERFAQNALVWSDADAEPQLILLR
jgi:hypothetical protein